MVQIIAKVFLIGALFVGAGGALYVAIRASMWIWQHDIDVKKLVRVDRWLDRKVEETVQNIPVREPDGIYQQDKLVARVNGAKIDEANKSAFFQEIYQSNTLDLNQPFTYQHYKLRFVSFKTFAGVTMPHIEKGQVMTEVKCEILE